MKTPLRFCFGLGALTLVAVTLGALVTGLARPAHAASDVATADKVTFSALLQDGEIAGCAVKAAFKPGKFSADIAISLVRDKTTEMGTRFVLSGAMFDGDGRVKPLTTMVMKTAGLNSESTFAKPAPTADGRFEASATLGALQGGEMMRDLMLSGADIGFVLEGSQQPVTLKIIGPLEPYVRAGYLNCAGDIFRPEAAANPPK